MKTYYELLEVAADAPADEIKRAFRREIAKYHPDKVSHLGKEFQEIAANKAAELTQAYTTLSDASLRAEYDALLAEGGPAHAAAAQAAGAARPAAQPEPARAYSPPTPPPAALRGQQFASEQQGISDFLKRATVARFKRSLGGEFGKYEEVGLQGFDVAVIPTPPFWSLKLPPRVLGRFVATVDRRSVAETWGLAVKMKKDSQRDLCVFLMGPSLAPAGELAAAIAEQRRKPMPAGGKLVLIPVNTTTWSAHVPTDAPNVVKSLLTRLQSK